MSPPGLKWSRQSQFLSWSSLGEPITFSSFSRLPTFPGFWLSSISKVIRGWFSCITLTLVLLPLSFFFFSCLSYLPGPLWFHWTYLDKVISHLKVRWTLSNICRSLWPYSDSRSVQFSRSVVSDSLRPRGLQHTRLPCPSPTPGADSNSCPLSRCCHPTISSSVTHFSSYLQSFPASGSFWRRQWHTSPVLMPGKSHGWKSLVGCSPWSHEESNMTERFHFHFHFHALEQEMATHSSVFAWRIPGMEEPDRLSSMGSHRDRHDCCDLAAAAAAGSFPMSQFFASGGQSIGVSVSASASVLPMNIQDWFPLGLTGLISLQSKWLSGVFSNTAVQNSLVLRASIPWCLAFFIVQLSHPYTTTGKTIALTKWTFVGKSHSVVSNSVWLLPPLSIEFSRQEYWSG